jgi:hypothetical protein
VPRRVKLGPSESPSKCRVEDEEMQFAISNLDEGCMMCLQPVRGFGFSLELWP